MDDAAADRLQQQVRDAFGVDENDELTVPLAKPRLLDCGLCYEEDGEEVHPHPECTRVSPKYVKDSILWVKAYPGAGWGSRFRILDIVKGYYRLKPLSGDSFSFDLVLWKCEHADANQRVTVEWIDNNPRYGVIEQHGVSPRRATAEELRELGVATDENP